MTFKQKVIFFFTDWLPDLIFFIRHIPAYRRIETDYGFGPDGLRFALEQYQKLIWSITNGRMSKLNYYAKDIVHVAEECSRDEARWVLDGPRHYKCSSCESKWNQAALFMEYCPTCGARMVGGDF